MSEWDFSQVVALCRIFLQVKVFGVINIPNIPLS